MSDIKYYFTLSSPPCRAVLLLIRYLKIDVDLKPINLQKGEQHDPEYLKINPAHQVPVLIDGDFVLTESRAILGYLANSRNPGSDLYPTEVRARARVDQLLSFDGELFYRQALVVVSKIKMSSALST